MVGILQIRKDGTRSRTLHCSEHYIAELVYYPAAIEQGLHAHSAAQVSFLLAGCFGEVSDGRDLAPVGQKVGYKPAGAAHSVRFGHDGALMLAIDLAQDHTGELPPRSWRPSSHAAREQLTLLLGGAETNSDVIDGLMASIGAAPDLPSVPIIHAPLWLRRAIAHIADDPSVEIASLAAEAGIHRVHFSRVFQRFTGMSPTRFRLHRKCAAATRLLIEGRESPAAAAVAAGFADQSHWTRASQTISGISPGRMHSLLAA